MYYLDDITNILVRRGYSAENPITLSNGDRSTMFKKGNFSATVWEYVNRAGARTVSIFVSYCVNNNIRHEIAATNGNKRYEYTNIPSDTMVGLLSNTINTLGKLRLLCANAVTETLLNTL